MGYVTLEGEKNVQIRRTTRADLEALLGFFRQLSPAERRYLRRDVTDPGVVDALLREVEQGRADRRIALDDGNIIGFGALIFEEEAWQRHLGEIRVIVAEDWRRRRLGAVLIRTMLDDARDRGISKVVARMPAAQEGVRKMLEHLGFRVDAVLPGHVVDAEGAFQDLVVMSCSLDSVTEALREFCRDDNWADG